MGFHNSKKYSVSSVFMSRMEEELFGTNGRKIQMTLKTWIGRPKRLPEIVKTALRSLWWAAGNEQPPPLFAARQYLSTAKRSWLDWRDTPRLSRLREHLRCYKLAFLKHLRHPHGISSTVTELEKSKPIFASQEDKAFYLFHVLSAAFSTTGLTFLRNDKNALQCFRMFSQQHLIPFFGVMNVFTVLFEMFQYLLSCLAKQRVKLLLFQDWQSSSEMSS